MKFLAAPDEPEHFPMQPHVSAPPSAPPTSVAEAFAGSAPVAAGSPPIEKPALAQWLRAQEWSDFAQSLARSYAQYGGLTSRQWESARSMHEKTPASKESAPQAQRSPRREPEPGFYKVGDAIFKVQMNRAGTSRYAKKLGCSDGAPDWEYVGKQPFSTLTEETRLSVEEAAAFGRETGHCIICSRTLTAPESVERGIGPVCITLL